MAAPALPRPTLSAVLVNYNHGRFLPEALGAAVGQTVPFDDVLVLDDGSTDNSVEVIESLIHDVPHARLVRNPHNIGVIATANRGLHEAKGDFIFFMAADDVYSRRIVEHYRAIIDRYPHVAMISGNVSIKNVDKGTLRTFALPFPQEPGCYSRTAMAAIARKRAFTFYGGGNIIRRDALIEAGEHLPLLKWHADWFLYLLLANRYPFAVAPYEFTCIRQAAQQYSHACYDWKKQGPVIAYFIRTLQKDYPDDYPFFRDCALLPTYDIKTFFLLLRDAELRPYLTPLLAWRLLTYKPMRAIARSLLPNSVLAKIRHWFRV